MSNSAIGWGSMTFVLRVISGKYEGGEVSLKASAQLVIGRANEVGMVLSEDMVSRKHAKITVSDMGKVLIEDLGSTNGTFVNGEKVKQARLQEGDRILIGTSILKLVQQRGEGGLSLEDAEKDQARRPSSITGNIQEIPLPDVLQLLHTSKKTAVLEVRGELVGRIYLRNGSVVCAEIDEDEDLDPVKSFFRILAWERGVFQLSPHAAAEFPRQIEQPFEALLMEGVKQLDEYRQIKKDLPSEKDRLSLKAPVRPPLRALSPEELDVLQLVLNQGHLQGVLDRSERDDVSTARVLLQLINKDYVHAG